MTMKTCKKCNTEKAADQFYKIRRRKDGTKIYRRNTCSGCVYLSEIERRTSPAYKLRANKLRRQRRQDPNKRAKVILEDARANDHKLNRICNLILEDVQQLIMGGCSYCGGHNGEVKMSIDRIDNTKGHEKDNVVASCLSCNLIRSNMPHAAWLLVAKALREARSRGLLAGWSCRNHKGLG